MSVSTQEILDSISNMSVMEVVQLIEAMEEKFGVSAATMAMPMTGMPVAGQAAAAVEQTEFTVVMTNFGSNKVNVIKVVRAITSLGLKEAKDLVEALPATIKESIKKEDADKMKKELEEAGATVEVK